MININFVNTGADEAILKSMDTENCSEELVKAMNKQGLVQKEIQVKGKNGTFTRKQWVSASGDDSGSQNENTAENRKNLKKQIDDYVKSHPNPTDSDRKTVSEMRDKLDKWTKEAFEPAKQQMRQSTQQALDNKPKSKKLDPVSPDVKKQMDKVLNDAWKASKGRKTDDLPKTSTGAIDWNKMVQDGDFTAEQKSELSYGVSEKHACVVEKDGKIKTTKDWDEADYAEKKGWRNLGSVTEILKQGKLPIQSTTSNDKTSKARKVNSVDDFSLGAKAINRRLAKELNIHNSIGVVPNSVAGNGVGTVTVVAFAGKLSHQCKNSSEMEKFVKDQLTKEFGKDFVSKVKTKKDGDMEFVLSLADGNGSGNNGGGKSTASSSDGGDGGDKKTSRKQWVNPKSAQEAKSQIKGMIDSGMSREDCMSELKSAGVSWKHSDHAGINWMRAMQAAQKPVADDTSDDDGEDTINYASLPKNKVQSIVHSYIGGLTVQEDVDVRDVIDHIRENYTNNDPLDDETYTAVEDAVKELTDRAKNGI